MRVDGKPVVRVVIDVTVSPDADEDTLSEIGEVLAERMGDNLDHVLGVNVLMTDNEVTCWHVRAEPAIGEDVTDPGPLVDESAYEFLDTIMEGDS